MLEQPRPEDVGGHLGEDPSLLGVLLAGGVVVVTTVGAVSAPHARITRIACARKKEKNLITPIKTKRASALPSLFLLVRESH